MNEIIKEKAQQENIFLVDYEANLSGKSPAGIIGKEFMLEHLHPNLQGYFILADSFYQSIMQNDFPDIDKKVVSTNITGETVRYYQQRVLRVRTNRTIEIWLSLFPRTDRVCAAATDWLATRTGTKTFSKEIDWITMIADSYRGYVDERNLSMIASPLKFSLMPCHIIIRLIMNLADCWCKMLGWWGWGVFQKGIHGTTIMKYINRH